MKHTNMKMVKKNTQRTQLMNKSPFKMMEQGVQKVVGLLNKIWDETSWTRWLGTKWIWHDKS